MLVLTMVQWEAMEERVTPIQHYQKRRWLLIGVGGITAVIIFIALWWFFAVRETGPIPRTYLKGLSFTPYYPASLPNGYAVDQKSFERKDGVLIFSITAPGNRNIAVAEQLKPADAPVHGKPNTPMPVAGERSFDTTAGQAYISLWGDKYVSDISAPNGTWIILNVTGFTADEATRITKSFVEL